MISRKLEDVVQAGIFILFISVIVLSIICYSKSRVIEELLDDCRKLTNMNVNVQNQFRELETVGSQIDDLILMNDEGQLVDLSELINDSIKLIFRFAENQCNSCYESQLEIIGNLLKSECNDLIIIVNNDDNLRKIKLILQRYSIEMSVYKLCSSHEVLPLDAYGKPYFFRINKDFCVFDTFIPDKHMPEFSSEYLKGIFLGRK